MMRTVKDTRCMRHGTHVSQDKTCTNMGPYNIQNERGNRASRVFKSAILSLKKIKKYK